jgi:hypothetical protein
MAKLNRERALKEKRALKQEKKEARKQAAADAQGGSTTAMAESVEPAVEPLARDYNSPDR